MIGLQLNKVRNIQVLALANAQILVRMSVMFVILISFIHYFLIYYSSLCHIIFLYQHIIFLISYQNHVHTHTQTYFWDFFSQKLDFQLQIYIAIGCLCKLFIRVAPVVVERKCYSLKSPTSGIKPMQYVMLMISLQSSVKQYGYILSSQYQ